MVTGNDILSYQGNANLGQTSKTLAYANPDDDKQVAQSLSEIGQLNFQANQLKWQQKIKDRDQTMAEISADQLQINQSLPKDRPQLEKMVDDIKNYWIENKGDVKSDSAKWWEFNDKLAKFRDARVYAGSRFDSYQKGLAEASQQVDPNKKKAQIGHYDEEAQTDLYHAFTPYQHTLDWDESVINRPVATKDTQLGPDKTNPYNTITNSRSQVHDAFADYQNEYQYGGKGAVALNVNEWLKNWTGQTGLMGVDDVMDRVGKTNEKLDEIARKEGYNPDDQNSVPEELRHLDMKPIGESVKSNSPAWSDWYKIQLADKYKNENTSVYDKNMIDKQLKQSQIGLNDARAKKELADATTNRIKANGYNKYMTAKAQGNTSKNVADISQVYDTLVNKIDKVVTTKSANGMSSVHAINTSELPASYQNINGVVTDRNGKLVAGKLEPFNTTTGKKEPYYKVNYYDPTNGQKIDIENSGFLKDKYQQVLGAKQLSSKQLSYMDYIRTIIKKQALGVEFEGKNGTANVFSLGQSVRAVNDQITGKGDESVFSSPDNDSSPDSENSSSSSTSVQSNDNSQQ